MKTIKLLLSLLLIGGMACAMEEDNSLKEHNKQEEKIAAKSDSQNYQVLSLKELCVQEIIRLFPKDYFRSLPTDLSQLLKASGQLLLKNHPLYKSLEKDSGLLEGKKLLDIVKTLPERPNDIKKRVQLQYLSDSNRYEKSQLLPTISQQLTNISVNYCEAFIKKKNKLMTKYYSQFEDFVETRKQALEMIANNPTHQLIRLFDKLWEMKKKSTKIELTKEEEVKFNEFHPTLRLVLRQVDKNKQLE